MTERTVKREAPMCNYSTLPLKSRILGKQLNAGYYENMQETLQTSEKLRKFGLRQRDKFFVYGKRGAFKSLPLVPRTCVLGFTGRQDLSNAGWRITHMIAQVATAMDIIPISGHAYGADLAVEMGALSKDEFIKFGDKQPASRVRQVVVLPSGIESRAPTHAFVDNAIVKFDGVFIALIPGESCLMTELLSPRDRMIAELCDVLIVTEAGTRGTMDTIHWAIELGRPISAIKWNEVTEARTGWLILRELSREKPDTVMLGRMLTNYFDHATSHYSFSPVHPAKLAENVRRDSVNNEAGYRSAAECALTLVEKVKSRKVRIELIEADDVLPPHDGNQSKRNVKAGNIRDYLSQFGQTP